MRSRLRLAPFFYCGARGVSVCLFLGVRASRGVLSLVGMQSCIARCVSVCMLFK